MDQQRQKRAVSKGMSKLIDKIIDLIPLDKKKNRSLLVHNAKLIRTLSYVDEEDCELSQRNYLATALTKRLNSPPVHDWELKIYKLME